MKTLEKFTKHRVLFILFFIGLSFTGMGQINEPKTATVYDYLTRMAQKGLLEWPDWQTPLQRDQIYKALKQLDSAKASLSVIENAELRFYQQEYAFDADSLDLPETKVILRKDPADRFRSFSYQKGENRFFLDPVFGGGLLYSGGRSSRHSFSGIRLGGYFGKRWGFNFSFRDNMEKGDTVDFNRSFSSQEGIVSTISTARILNFSQLNFNLTYRWPSGTLTLGQENLSWGYGIGGNNTLSGKAPAFPFIKFDYRPWSWLHFTYFHGWLHSNIIDSAASYNTGSGIYGSQRDIYRPKYIAQHAIMINPVRGLQFGLGESVIYSDDINFGYLLPISFFRIFDHQRSRYNIKASDNSQFFGLVSSRNHLRNTHIYAQLFIDEIRLSKILSQRENRNQLGYTIGINRTDLFLHYLTAGLEYTRLRPFIYSNLLPTQSYENHGYTLGDWMGNNADRLYAFVHYTPLPKLKVKIWGQQVRKGAAGTLAQQYFQQPQPPFLFEKLFDWKETGVSLTYEWLNKLLFNLTLNQSNFKYTNSTQKNQGLRLGFSYGI